MNKEAIIRQAALPKSCEILLEESGYNSGLLCWISLLKNITSVVIQKESVLTIIEDNHNLSNWDVNIGEKLIGPKYFNKSIESVEPLRKNKCIILGYKNSLEIIDGLSYKSKKKINPFNFGKITIIKTSKDGSYFAVGSSKGKIRLYDSKTYKRLGKYQFDASIIDIAFVNGSNSAIILTKSNNSLFYLNFSEEEIIPFDNEGFDLLKVFSVDNNQIISIDKIGELIYWDLFTLKKIRAIRLKS